MQDVDRLPLEHAHKAEHLVCLPATPPAQNKRAYPRRVEHLLVVPRAACRAHTDVIPVPVEAYRQVNHRLLCPAPARHVRHEHYVEAVSLGLGTRNMEHGTTELYLSFSVVPC